MKKIVLLFFTLVSLLLAEDSTKKVVIDLTTGDPKVFETKILSGIVSHKTYFEGKMEELDVAIIIHGGAYKFFVENLKDSPYAKDKVLLAKQKEYAARLKALVDTYGVELYMCDSGRKKHKIDMKVLYPYVKTVVNAAVGLIEKQNDGYAYVPVEK